MEGSIDLAWLEQRLAQDRKPTLVSVMLVNNETGVINPVAEVARLAREAGALFHCDAVQAAGKLALDFQELGADFMSLAAQGVELAADALEGLRVAACFSFETGYRFP